jgi:hypothetical protein
MGGTVRLGHAGGHGLDPPPPNAIPIARVQAMHEGKRRARARRADGAADGID